MEAFHVKLNRQDSHVQGLGTPSCAGAGGRAAGLARSGWTVRPGPVTARLRQDSRTVGLDYSRPVTRPVANPPGASGGWAYEPSARVVKPNPLAPVAGGPSHAPGVA